MVQAQIGSNISVHLYPVIQTTQTSHLNVTRHMSWLFPESTESTCAKELPLCQAPRYRSILFQSQRVPRGFLECIQGLSKKLWTVWTCIYEYINTIEYWVSTLKRTKLTKFLQVRQKQTKNKVLGVHRWEESSSSRAMHRRIESSFGLASSIGTWPAFATVAEVDFGSAWAKASMSDAETIPSPSPATAMFERNGNKIGKTWENSTEKIWKYMEHRKREFLNPNDLNGIPIIEPQNPVLESARLAACCTRLSRHQWHSALAGSMLYTCSEK